ncbi:MAG: type II toxin-antitoxin system VapC family toxin [Nitrososphaerales archaeon]
MGIDSSVLVPFLIPDHPWHESLKKLESKRHAVNPTVLHETYHVSVFKLKRTSEETATILRDYMKSVLCLPLDSSTVDLGLTLATQYSLRGRDALILANFLISKQVKEFATFDNQLLSLKKIVLRGKSLSVTTPGLNR